MAAGTLPHRYLSTSTPHHFAWEHQPWRAEEEAAARRAPISEGAPSSRAVRHSARAVLAPPRPSHRRPAIRPTSSRPPDAAFLIWQVLDLVLLPLCHDLGIPLLLRMGTRRGINASLGLAGDGLGSASLTALSNLCAAHPRTKFLVTVRGGGRFDDWVLRRGWLSRSGKVQGRFREGSGKVQGRGFRRGWLAESFGEPDSRRRALPMAARFVGTARGLVNSSPL